MDVDSKTYRVPQDEKVNLSKWPTIVDPYCESKKAYSRTELANVFGVTGGARLKSLLTGQARCCCASQRLESAAFIANVQNGIAWRPS
jgi:hypothetical protein